MLTGLSSCIAAGKMGGGTFLPNCGKEGTTQLTPANFNQKVNGWGPYFSDDG